MDRDGEPGGWRDHALMVESTSGEPHALPRCPIVMRCRVMAPLLFVGGTGAANAQSIRGVVFDVATQKPVPGATVQVSFVGEPRQTASDSAGNFFLSLPAGGIYSISAMRIGYLRHSGDTVRVGDAETVTLRIELDQNAVPLHPVVVTARRSRLPAGFEQRRAAGFGRFLDHTDIEKRHPTKTSDLFRGIAGVHLAPLPRGVGLRLLFRKPSGLCAPAIYIDGLPLGDHSQPLDLMMDSNLIDAVELYPSVSTAPAQFRTGNCGIVLFWTRQGPQEPQAKPKGWKVALGVTAALSLLLVLR